MQRLFTRRGLPLAGALSVLFIVAQAWAQGPNCPCQNNMAQAGAFPSAVEGQPMYGQPGAYPGAPLPMGDPSAAYGCGGCAYGSGDTYHVSNGLWTASVNAVYMTRANNSSTFPATAVLVNDTVNAIDYTGRDYRMGWEIGPGVTFSRKLGDFAIDVKFTMIDGYDDQLTLGAAGAGDSLDIRFPGNSPISATGGFLAETFESTYSSRWYDGEIDWKYSVWHNINVFLGFRWFQLHERLNGSWTEVGGLDGAFDSRVNNQMYGFQMGVDGTVLNFGWLQIGAFGNAGIYGNHVRAQFASSLGTGDYDIDDDRAAFLSSAGVTLNMPITAHLSAFGGYQAMFLDGIALAPNTMAAGALTTDHAIYHGGFAGARLIW